MAIFNSIIEGKNVIGGELCDAVSGERFEVLNPATGEVLGSAPFSGPADVDGAVKAAKAAQVGWAKVSTRERGAMLLEIAQLFREEKEMLVELMVKDTGKALTPESKPEIELVPKALEYYAGLALEIKGETVPFDNESMTMTVRQPVGVVGAILPWNVPLMLMCFKICPAIMCGNTVVVKSPEQSPLIMQKAVELFNRVLPKGVCNLVSGDGPVAGAAVVEHAGVDKVSFTGSVEVGKIVNEAAARRLVPVTLELGGKSPMVICEDADLGEVLEGAVTGMRFTRQGQSCSAASRIFVHSSLYERFLEGLEERLCELKIGDPMDETVDVGAMISKEQYDRVCGYLEAGAECGEVVECGDLPEGMGGYYHRPTIIKGVRNDDVVAREEIFGPVVCVMAYDDFDEAMELANATEYGLAATVWTRDINRALRFVHEVEAGFVQVNQNRVVSPGLSYGGVKDSGVGKEASLESMLEHFTHKKTIIMKKPS